MDEAIPNLMKRVSMRLVGLVFLPIFLCLAAGYYFFLRPDFIPVFTALRTQQAASIAKVLSSKSISFRLVPDGTAIEVPSDKAAEARLAIVGSDVNPGATTGFELFNKSDMGLTDFAQKINFQRALQGELERTILSIDGVETARVHLALPEKSLFRSVRSAAKASVQIGTRSDTPLDPARVTSLQHLVASAVPDLEPGAVTVVDESGALLSTQMSNDPDGDASPDIEERRAYQHLLRARLRRAVMIALPDLQFDVTILAVAGQPGSASAGVDGNERSAGPSGPMHATILTPAPLEPEQQKRIAEIARSAIEFDPASGDAIVFETGVLPTAVPASAAGLQISGPKGVDHPSTAQTQSPPLVYLIALVLAGLSALALLWWWTAGERAKRGGEGAYHADLANRIRAALLPMREDGHGE
ncbi:flagellar basal-body MS-ring/collar protein FliF [Novosphingobium sp. AAP93]|uniref:flagellar basal-body MS-ring/collar protein FliF n=1 Tax=Novosphingobium sp. AAP93 TaxID=1523427 RepID=UPI0006B9A283|nr:flagellar basal-body MS-ring/collar protein FliF [Novosphingobium sp. AAP93]